jgi:hydrogenase nickel incorporation protein HypA/HybF
VHEVSVAQRIVEAVCEAMADEPPCRVTVVRVRIGAMAGVVPEALLFAFDTATDGTEVAGARLELEMVDAVVWCETCRAEHVLTSIQRLRCPACDEPTPHVVRGRELELSAVEVMDATENRAGAAAGAQEE